MASSERPDLEARLSELEARLSELEARLAALEGRRPAPAPPSRTPAPSPPSPPTAERVGRLTAPLPEVALGCLGALLLFLGMGFAFLYAVRQGWFGPGLRVLLGLALAAVLGGLGTVLRRRRPGLAGILMGAGVALAYLSLFAGARLYGLLPRPLAFAGMVLTTLLAGTATALAGVPGAAALGLLGGLSVPLLLGGEGGSALSLTAYLLLILLGAAAVLWRRPAPGVLAVLTLAAWPAWAFPLGLEPVGGARWGVQAGILAAALLAVGVPLGTAGRRPAPAGLLGILEGGLAYLALILTPWPALLLTWALWDLERIPLGGLFLAAAGLYALAAARGPTPPGLPRAREVGGGTAWLLSLVGWVLLLGDRPDLLLLALAAEAFLLLGAGLGRGHLLLRLEGNLLLAGTALWILVRELGRTAPLGESPVARVDLLILLALALWTWIAFPRPEGPLWEGILHLNALVWMAREGSALGGSGGVVSAAWALYAALLFALALGTGRRRLYWEALALLILVGGKAVLLDTAAVPLLWRAVLFLFLGVLYLVLAWWGRRGALSTSDPSGTIGAQRGEDRA